ncbi:MAG: AAA family ATPase [Phormidesmis sp. RL_2_1]|nr:AAA family ATPase [Phormidesmis sp. RL_2_1]
MNTDPAVIADLSGYTIVEKLSDDPCILNESGIEVYRALQINSQQPVVIKALCHTHPSAGMLAQFRNQYEIARHLDHPAFTSPLLLKRWGNRDALIMPDEGFIALTRYRQQLAGQPLRQAAEPQGNLSVVTGLEIAIQLADALHYLIGQRIIHKDIKPDNILIHPQTGQIKLIDFSIACLLPKEHQQLANPTGLEGTLAYISPEQTGRMNRAIDYRSDFYALGVTIYELLTGQLPFTSDDPMALIHSHMTLPPPAAHEINAAVPPILSAIVIKLMAKNAEDRYQSALGLKYDLQRCRDEFLKKEHNPADTQDGSLSEFKLGEKDIRDQFLIPEKLYGRQEEVTALLNAFDRASKGQPELMLIAGFSGIGKTAVVNEVHKPMTRQNGYFIQGKFDQFNRSVPFSAFVQAFRSLMGQLLGESDGTLQRLKQQIIQAVGTSAQVLLEVIPELEYIIGPQPAVPELSGSAAQNRFNLTLNQFVSVFTTAEHPLVIFLDDLQWADSASLNLLKLLLSESRSSSKTDSGKAPKIGHLLIVGAYRDNEVWPVHPLMLTLDEIKRQSTPFTTLTLAALEHHDITGLVADALLCSPDVALPLSKLIYTKTQGNPFSPLSFCKDCMPKAGLPLMLRWAIGNAISLKSVS